MKESYLSPVARRAMVSLTATELIVCLLIPIVGFFLGIQAKTRGRQSAGNKMLLLSTAIMVIGVSVRILLISMP
jgi:hypothetical protein